MVDVFLLKTLLKLLKMLPKLNIIFGFSPRKKNKPLFSKSFVSNILCPKNKKNFSENFLLKKQVLTRVVYKSEKEKEGLYLQSFDLNDKTLLILFKAKFAYCQKQNREHLPLEKKKAFFLFCIFQSCFFFQVSKMKEAKNKQTRSEVFFLFVKTTMLLCRTMKHFFVSQLSKINKPLAIAFG